MTQQQDWNWLIEYIESRFNLDDIQTWDDFQSRNTTLVEILQMFIRIVQIENHKLKINNKILEEQYILAKYFVNQVSFDESNKYISSNYSKILLLFLWIAKLENDTNQTDYILDRGIYHYKNYWQLIDFSLVLSNVEELKAYTETISIKGFEDIKSIIYKNFEREYYEMNPGFIENYQSNLVNCNTFSHQLINQDTITWQESFILDMLKVSIDNRELIPLSQFGENTNPEIKKWTKEIIDSLKTYFNNNISILFVLESISYILHKNIPSKEIMLLHCKLLTSLLENLDKDKSIFCSSFTIISYLFKDNLIKTINGEDILKRLMKTIHNVQSPELIEILKEYYIPVSKAQNKILLDFYKTECSKINYIDDIYKFDHYLSNTTILKYIDKEHFNIICKKFYNCINNTDENLIIPNLFYKFMIFLLNSRSYCSNIEKRVVDAQLIKAQQTWQTNFYKKIVSSLHESSFSTTIPKEEIEQINSLILDNPTLLINKTLQASNKYILYSMENISKYPMQAMITHINIDETYPVLEQYEKMINKNNTNLEVLLKNIITNLIEKEGYKLINYLTPEYFISCIHREWISKIEYIITLFNREEELYTKIVENSKIELLEYRKDICLAYITQLFPILEIKIRDLALLFGIVPFKGKTEEFWKYRDPSSILLEIIENVYKNVEDFGVISDILMVYNFMYNNNSLNIRNECIHGRKYINDTSLKFAFKVTLLAIFTIMQRIETINKAKD